jgi:hypothetical protein
MNEHRMKRSSCPHCGSEADCASGIGSECPPIPGSLSICIMCGGFLKFNADLCLEALPDAEFQELPSWLQLKMKVIRNTVAEVNEKKRQGHQWS